MIILITGASDIESRLDDSCCTAAALKAENRKYIEGFYALGEEVVFINSKYEKTLESLINI